MGKEEKPPPLPVDFNIKPLAFVTAEKRTLEAEEEPVAVAADTIAFPSDKVSETYFSKTAGMELLGSFCERATAGEPTTPVSVEEDVTRIVEETAAAASVVVKGLFPDAIVDRVTPAVEERSSTTYESMGMVVEEIIEVAAVKNCKEESSAGYEEESAVVPSAEEGQEPSMFVDEAIPDTMKGMPAGDAMEEGTTPDIDRPVAMMKIAAIEAVPAEMKTIAYKILPKNPVDEPEYTVDIDHLTHDAGGEVSEARAPVPDAVADTPTLLEESVSTAVADKPAPVVSIKEKTAYVVVAAGIDGCLPTGEKKEQLVGVIEEPAAGLVVEVVSEVGIVSAELFFCRSTRCF